MRIESGTGNGLFAAVDSEKRLSVAAITQPRQHVVAKTQEKAFQVIGEASIASGTENVLHIVNNTTDQTFTVTYIRMSAITNSSVPVSGEYFELVTGLTYSSGGTSKSEVNTYLGSNVTSGGTFYEDNPTLTGSAIVLDKHFTQSNGQEHSYRKEGSIVISPGNSMTVRYTGTGSGTAYTRVSFYESPVNSLDL